MTKSQLGALMVLWVALAFAVIQQLTSEGIGLFYPVLLAWLGGLVSFVLLREFHIRVIIRDSRPKQRV